MKSSVSVIAGRKEPIKARNVVELGRMRVEYVIAMKVDLVPSATAPTPTLLTIELVRLTPRIQRRKFAADWVDASVESASAERTPLTQRISSLERTASATTSGASNTWVNPAGDRIGGVANVGSADVLGTILGQTAAV